MKSVLVFAGVLLISVQLWGQIPERKNRAMVYKTTATWCYPCGTWGWDLANNLNAEFGDDIVYLALFNSSDGSYNNSAFFNATAVTLAFNFRYSSWPSFGVNGYNLSDASGNQAAAIYQACRDSASVFNNSPVIANAASNVSIDPNGDMEVSTTATFFEPTEGDYYLASYLVEEGARNQQRGHSGLVEHKGVLHVAIDSLDWGSLIASGAIDSGYTVKKTYNYTVSDENWDLSKLVVCNVMWKKVGTKYVYVNGSKHGPGLTSIAAASESVIGIQVFPNPATDILQIELEGLTHPYAFRIMDITGREVWREHISDTRKSHTVDVSKLPGGLYVLQVSSNGVHVQRKVWVK